MTRTACGTWSPRPVSKSIPSAISTVRVSRAGGSIRVSSGGRSCPASKPGPSGFFFPSSGGRCGGRRPSGCPSLSWRGKPDRPARAGWDWIIADRGVVCFRVESGMKKASISLFIPAAILISILTPLALSLKETPFISDTYGRDYRPFDCSLFYVRPSS